MDVKLLYVTPRYHKLVESVARVCYQSYDKVNESSHKMVKGIMTKGHLSIASVGNIVFGISDLYHTDTYCDVLEQLVTFKEINNYIRWSFKDSKNNPDSKFDLVVSMNVLTLLDILKGIECYGDVESTLLEYMLQELSDVDEIQFFINDEYKEIDGENPFTCFKPQWGKPIILSQDYHTLKPFLTPYELNIHATVTVDIATDRATGLQMWRHADMTGGCELSQRYVDRANADFRIPEDLDEEDQLIFQYHMGTHIDDYEYLKSHLEQKGFRKGRAKEIARNLLPNVETRIIQCRPLRQWKHFFSLRDSVHAQKEMQFDAKGLKKAFIDADIPIE